MRYRLTYLRSKTRDLRRNWFSNISGGGVPPSKEDCRHEPVRSKRRIPLEHSSAKGTNCPAFTAKSTVYRSVQIAPPLGGGSVPSPKGGGVNTLPLIPPKKVICHGRTGQNSSIRPDQSRAQGPTVQWLPPNFCGFPLKTGYLQNFFKRNLGAYGTH